MLHGLNSHIGHGAHIAHAFANHGYVTVGFDHRGFGRSPGKPGKVASLEQHLEDTFQFVTLMKKEYPKLPFFCMGLSMGGMATYYTTLKHP
jgi:acylglycerol lipase